MNGSEIHGIISSNPCIRPHFRGVFSKNTLPTDIRRFPSVYVVNTDASDRPGEHWVAIVLMNPHYGIFFDSFGRRPEKEFRDFMDTNVERYDYFDVQIQSPSSIFCGLFVLAFLVSYFCMLMSLNDFKTLFDKKKLSVNDCIVFDYVTRYIDL